MKWYGAAAAVVALLALVPFLIPTSALTETIQGIADEKLGVPVTIGSLRMHLLPLPHVTVTDLRIGSNQAVIERTAVYPDLLSLLSDTRVLRKVEVSGVSFKDGVFALIKPPAKTEGPPPVIVRRIVVRDVRPELKGQPLGAWDADLEFAEDQSIERAELKSGDGKLKADLTPAGGKQWDLTVKGREWRPPVGPPILFTTLDASGKVTEKQVDLQKIHAGLYGGTLDGNLRLDHAPTLNLSGTYQAKGVDVAQLVKVFQPKQALGGKLDTDGKLAGRAAKPEMLADALQVTGRFRVANGVLYGIDLASAASRLIGGNSKGDTKFDELRGDYAVQGKNVKLRQLVLSSGVLEAKGNVEIAGGSKLGGTMDVNLRNTAGLVGVPLAFSGTLADPAVRPTKGTAIGAAVGTAVLPGLGTSLGASVGRFFEKKTE